MSTTISSTTTLNDRSAAVFTITLALLVLSTAFSGARLISKWGIVRKRTADDYVAVLAWIFAAGMSITILLAARYGLGKPDASINPAYTLRLKRYIYGFTTLYNPALMTTKTAILILYIRMSTAHPFLRYASWFVLAIVDIAGIVLTFLNIFQCRPVSAAYNRIPGECIDLVSLYLSSAPINILTDLAILLFPLPILTSLRMELRQKIVLVATFIVGGFVTIVDIVRIVYLQNALKEDIKLGEGSKISATNRPSNFTWHISFTLMWSAVEVNVGLICCCILVLKPLVMVILPQILKRKRDSEVIRSDPEISKEKKGKIPETSGTNGNIPESPEESNESSGLGLVHNLPMIGEDEFQVESYHDPIKRAGTMRSNSLRLDMEIGPRNEVPTTRGGQAEEEEEEGEMDFMQMLASSGPSVSPTVNQGVMEMPDVSPVSRRNTAPLSPVNRKASSIKPNSPLRSLKSRLSRHGEEINDQAPSRRFSDFVNLGEKKDLTSLTRKEAWWPILFVSSLFFMWGFGYSLLSTLNSHIEVLLDYSPSQAIGLINAYWLGYFFSPPLLGYWVLSRSGFRSTFIIGLSIYSIGALAFWPSSVLRSYPGFLVSNFIIAFGLSMLEIAANPFISLAGPGELAEARLNFSQGIQAVGVVVAPILAEKVLFNNIQSQLGLFNVQWCYLAVSLFVIALAVVFFYVPLPELDIDALEALTLQRLENSGLDSATVNSTVLRAHLPGLERYSLHIPLRVVLALIGGSIIWMYTGAQESLAYYWNPIHQVIRPQSDAFWGITLAHSLFAIGRFLAAFWCYIGIPPRIVLLIHSIGLLITMALTITLPAGFNRNGTYACLLLVLLFESAFFPTAWAMAMRNQGKKTLVVAGFMTSAISGGSIVPTMTYGVYSTKNGPNNPRKPQWISFSCFLIVFLLIIWENSNKKVRRWIDPRWCRIENTTVNGQQGNELERTRSRFEGTFEGWSWSNGLTQQSPQSCKNVQSEEEWKVSVKHVEFSEGSHTHSQENTIE
ncbi:uncharacterized protein I206_104280 [Kwoniella pini CBS 10737]|uniref:Rhodopsin domain-containing protein n=1 Tax=Kwoniella pini CBS 10737 TaxID=1296096 RepID=A0A1B9I253_9TREE|nr:uncharacterized protein I206_04144 [Kwoniella pini CBS 10737]OCF49622.1 hypothetical protein I206_04144 [Kwoniella pini CBS 10737]